MKIELPKEPDVDRLWTKDLESGKTIKWHRVKGGWQHDRSDGRWAWPQLLSRGPIYTTHPDFAALEKYPAPWTVAASGTVRSAGNAGTAGKVVLDPTLQCPPCLTTLIVRAVNELAERMSGGTAAGDCAADEEDEKR